MQSASKWLLGLAIALGGCGEPQAGGPVVTAGPPPPPAPPAPAGAVVPSGAIAPSGRLGHYSSGDGSVGFVLDRMGSMPKIRMDGSLEIVDFELDAKTVDHTDFVNHKVHAFLRFETNGRVTFVQGSASSVVIRDAGADSLRGGVGNVQVSPP